MNRTQQGYKLGFKCERHQRRDPVCLPKQTPRPVLSGRVWLPCADEAQSEAPCDPFPERLWETAIPFPAARLRMPTAKLQQEGPRLSPYRHAAAAAGCCVWSRGSETSLAITESYATSFHLSCSAGHRTQVLSSQTPASELHTQPTVDIFKGS